MCIYLIPNICCWIAEDYVNKNIVINITIFLLNFLNESLLLLYSDSWSLLFFVKLFQRIHLTSPESYQLQQTAEEDWRVYLLKCCDKTEKARKLVASNNTKSQKFWMMVNLFMSLVQSLSIAIGFFSCVTKSQD